MFPSRKIGLLILACFLCHWAPVQAQKVVLCDSFSQLEKHIQPYLDAQHTVVINFWATWCSPCVEELPFFEQLFRQYGDEKVEVVLVSLDFKSNHEKRVVPFVRDNKVSADVLHLTDMQTNTWMPKVHPDWDGALPFTVVLRGDRREAYAEKFKDFAELDTFVRPFLVASHPPSSASNGSTKK